jgi:hypothetical protein
MALQARSPISDGCGVCACTKHGASGGPIASKLLVFCLRGLSRLPVDTAPHWGCHR